MTVLLKWSTKQKILDTAERLFGEQGYAATSMRHIIADAGVNLAAIHYHFGSKEGLLDQVVMRKAAPMNAERLALLDRFEAEAAPRPAPVEKLLEALIAPAILMANQSPEFVKLMGRLHAEGLMPTLREKHFQQIALRFLPAFRCARPDLPEEELHWRVHFTIGAMAYTLISPPGTCQGAGLDAPLLVSRRLVTFLGGGFRAPVVQAETELEPVGEKR